MFTKRSAFSTGMLFLLLFATACGSAAATRQAPAATEAPAYNYVPQPAPTYGAPAPFTRGSGSTASGQPSASSNSQPYDMFFQDYGVNPSIDTEDDHLSTFGLDVDTGSYTVMRNYLANGNLPPSDSVRVEEYVNYFEQGYSGPTAHQAFGINIDGASSPFGRDGNYKMLRIGIQGYKVSEEERKDASLVFVIDVSGSMDMDNRLGLVKRSLQLLVKKLRPGDTVSIVVYGTQAHVVLGPTSGAEKDVILASIYSLHPEGVTNAEAGIRLGYKMAMRAYNPNGINRVILCSDGVANMGETSPGGILDEIKDHVREGVTLTTVGFGMDNYNDTLMEQLADNGDGFYAYVDNITEARRLFIENLTSTLQVIAMNAKVQVDFNPSVVANYRLVGFENRDIADDQFRNNNVDAGEIGAGNTSTALYEVKLRPEAYGRAATVFMRWEDPDTHSIVEISKDFDAAGLQGDFHEADPYFQRSVVVAEYAEILRESYWAKGSRIADIYEEALRLTDLLPNDDDLREFVDLARQAGELSQ